MPPAKISPNCGPIGGAGALAPGLCVGICGAPMGMDDAFEVLPPTIGFDLSSVCTFFNDIPFLMSPNSASLPGVAEGNGALVELGALGAAGPPIVGGGGGGGGGGPAMVSWSTSFPYCSLVFVTCPLCPSSYLPQP
jgi:hypothetical protein